MRVYLEVKRIFLLVFASLFQSMLNHALLSSWFFDNCSGVACYFYLLLKIWKVDFITKCFCKRPNKVQFEGLNGLYKTTPEEFRKKINTCY